MQYNLLSYGNSSNPTSYKDPKLKTIIGHFKPHILSTNEIYQNSSLPDNILNSVLGSGWAKGAYSNTTHDFQTNMLFWKSDKLELVNQVVISSIVRDIIAYRLYYKKISAQNDTIFLTVIVGHLKAGSDVSDENERAKEAQAIINYLQDFNVTGNCFLMGDLNIYNSNEDAYQKLTAGLGNIKFVDPVNMPGDWHSNPSFTSLHTQSTRTSNLSDGGVSGGLDDRFDFILTTQDAISSSRGIEYISGSYKVAGQDGQHHNKSLVSLPPNTSAPANVLQALYNMSDHLPVFADFIFDPSKFLTIEDQESMHELFSVVNPIKQNSLEFHFQSDAENKQFKIALYTMHGTTIFKNIFAVNDSGHYLLNLKTLLPQGIYLLEVCDSKRALTKKLIQK